MEKTLYCILSAKFSEFMENTIV